MWFWLSLIALLCWSGSDLFSKIGCQGEDDHLAHLKMVIAVGTVMGLHAAFEIFIGGTEISWSIIWTYLPVSLLYIGSMTLGYLGLRYIELSVSSPICNSSGARLPPAEPSRRHPSRLWPRRRAISSLIRGSFVTPARYRTRRLRLVRGRGR